MSVEILSASAGSIFFCNTSDWAFGPVMPDKETAEEFLKWLPKDPRQYQDHELEKKWAEFRAQQEEVSHV